MKSRTDILAVYMEIFSKSFRRINLACQNKSRNDPFWLLEYLLMLSGTHYEPKKWWQTISWYFYHLLALYQYCMQWLIVISNFARWNDTLMIIWSSITILILTLCYVKQIMLEYYREPILKMREFLNENKFSSGNRSVDSKIRSKFRKKSQIIIIFTIAMILIDQLMIMYPSLLRNRLYGIPDWVYSLDDTIASVLIAGFYPVFVLVWVSKLFSASVTMAIILIGLKGELKILALGYERVLVINSNFVEKFYHTKIVRDQFWKTLQLRMQPVVEHHIHLLENIILLQEIFRKLFFLIYYQSIVVIGAAFYVIFKEDISLCSVAIVFCVIIFILECYWWCYQIDSFESFNESIAENVLRQCSQLPYYADCHAQYIQARSSFMIVAIYCRSSASFSCFGMRQISMEVFASLMNTCYSVLMFLVNICG